jgi:hypothetical protein
MDCQSQKGVPVVQTRRSGSAAKDAKEETRCASTVTKS